MLQYPVLNDFYHLKNHPVLDYRVRGHKVCLEQIYFYLIRSNLSFRDQKKTVRYYFLAETIRYNNIYGYMKFITFLKDFQNV